MTILGTLHFLFLFACSYLKKNTACDICFYVDLDILTKHTPSEENINIVPVVRSMAHIAIIYCKLYETL